MSAARPGYLLPLGIIVVAAWLGLANSRSGNAQAVELLQNGDFAGSPPSNWIVADAHWDPEGNGAVLIADSSTVTLSQGGIETAGGASLHGELTVAVTGSTYITGTLWLRFFKDADSLPAVPSPVTALTASPQPLAIDTVAPPGATAIRFELAIKDATAGSSIAVSNASLLLTAPAPSPTPTNTPVTPSPSPPTTIPATATPPPPSSATPTKTPGATKTPKPATTPTSPPRPGLPAPNTGNVQVTPATGPATGPAATPEPANAWGLLRNGGFEQRDGDLPAYWEKYGGIPGLSARAHGGSWAATLLSNSDSTKWLHQVVPVTGGEWYRATAFGMRESGDGEYFLRISWYSAVDGSGTALSQADSPVSSSANWTLMDTGAIRAPAAARSARFRLMVRPYAGFSAAFDDARFLQTTAPTPAPSPTVPATSARPSPTPKAATTPSTTPTPPPSTAVAGRRSSISAEPGPLTLVITEVLPNPDVTEKSNDYEWIEVFNWGQAPVDLAGWAIGDARTIDTLPQFVLEPHSYVVIRAKSAIFNEGVPSVRVPDGRIGSGLNNGGDLVALLAPGGSTVDAMSYGDDRSVLSPAPAAPAGGQTLGRRATEPESGWAITLRPTPGEANVFPAEPSPTATLGGAPTGAATPAPTPAREAEELPIELDSSGPSPVPWILLGIAGGVGGLASLTAADRRWPGVRRRIQEWRDGG